MFAGLANSSGSTLSNQTSADQKTGEHLTNILHNILISIKNEYLEPTQEAILNIFQSCPAAASVLYNNCHVPQFHDGNQCIVT